MSSRSGRKLSTAEKKANRKHRKKLKKQTRIYPSPLPQLKYREYYIVISDYITSFLKANRRNNEYISTRINVGGYYAVVGLVAPNYAFVVNIISFKNDAVKIEICDQCRFVGNALNKGAKRQSRLYVYGRALSDPKMIDDLDVFLKGTLEILRCEIIDYEHVRSSHSRSC